MRLIVVSGDGRGAGKTTLAHRLSANVRSIASALRSELARKLPNYDWFNPTQEYKDLITVTEDPWAGLSVREVLVNYGQMACAADPLYWVRRTADELGELALREHATGVTVAVDDLRKTVELAHLRARFPKLLHLHVHYEGAIPEPQYQAGELASLADHIVTRGTQPERSER